jgi:hypothetical protein
MSTGRRAALVGTAHRLEGPGLDGRPIMEPPIVELAIAELAIVELAIVEPPIVELPVVELAIGPRCGPAFVDADRDFRGDATAQPVLDRSGLC